MTASFPLLDISRLLEAFALAAGGRAVSGGEEVALVLAVVFFAAIVVVRLVKVIKFLPKVTVYLLVGLVLGPGVLGMEGMDSYEAVGELNVLREMALAIILFLVGSEFRLEGLRGNLRRSAKISGISAVITLVLTFGGIFAAAHASSADIADMALPLALILSVFALEVGPASTLAVVREHSSHGIYTNTLKLLVGNDNLLAIFLFTAASLYVMTASSGTMDQLGDSLSWMLWPFPIGIGLGLALGWVETFEEKATYRLVMVLATLMAALGIAHAIEVSWLLTVMIAGFAYANSSVRGRPAVDVLRVLETPFYVIFFILTGASLHLDEVEKLALTAPLVGVAYIMCRTGGKFVGTWLGSKKAGLGDRRGKLLGASVLAHSAVVLALLAVISDQADSAGSQELISVAQNITTIVLGSVIVFEVFGPIMVKVATLKSGEVAIVDAVGHGGHNDMLTRLWDVVVNFGRHIGFHRKSVTSSLSDIVVNDRRALSASAGFSRVTKFIDHYPYDSFPVLNSNGFYAGFISFNEIKDASYDPLVNDLVRAADLVSSARAIDLDSDDIDSAYEHIRGLTNSALPVIRHDDDGNIVLAGVVLQRDLAALHVSEAGSAAESIEQVRRRKNSSYLLSQD